MPQNRTIQAGASTTFTASVTGLPPFYFQWYSNGIPIIGANSSSLTIANAQLYKAGAYSVVVSNAYGAATSISAMLNVITPSFAIALNAPSFSWSSSGNAPWFGVTDTTHDGSSAARSGMIADNQQSSLTTAIPGPGTVRFWWKVSSQSGGDYLRFLINGTEQVSRSGEADWQQRSFPLSAGENTVSWVYAKNASVSSGQDAVWVDQVEFLAPAPASIASPTALGNGSLQFTLQSDPGIAYEVQVSTNLATWTSLTTITNTSGSATYTTSVDNSRCRFYRLKLVQ